MSTTGHPSHAPSPRSAWLGLGLCIGALASCFSAEVVEGLPCSRDETCGPEHQCAFGYCRPLGFDAEASCEDGQASQGEFCYLDDATVEVPISGVLRDLAWADFDGNGFMDALTISDAVTIHFNTGDRSFDSVEIDVELSGDQLAALGFNLGLVPPSFEPSIIPRQIAVADFSGNGVPDVLASLEFSSSSDTIDAQPLLNQLRPPLWLLESPESEEPTLRPLFDTAPFGAAPFLSRGIAVGNFDGDELPDLVAITEPPDEPTRVDILLGDPESTLGLPMMVPLDGAGIPSVGDLDGDGIDDLAATDSARNAVRVLLGPYDAASNPIPTSIDIDERPFSVLMHDLDGDGSLDLLVAFRGGDDGFQAYLGDGSGEFEAGPAIVLEDLGEFIALAAADFDGDGTTDVVTMTDEGLFVHPGYGEGSFGSGFELHDDPAALIVAVHLDGDDAIDIVTGNPNLATIYFAER